MNMNVKKSRQRNFDKENSCESFNKIAAIKNSKKPTKTGEEIRRRMQFTSIGMTYSRVEPTQSLKLDTDFNNRVSNKSGLNFSGVRRSTDYFPLQTSRSTKSVKFQDKFDEPSLSRKHSTSSILKNKSNLKKSVLSERGSMKSSICSNIGKENQSSQNTAINKLVRQKYEALSTNLLKCNSKYTDELYPPLACSLHNKRNASEFKDITWMRISDVFTGKYLTLFSREPQSYYINSKIKAFKNCLNSVKHNNFLLQKIFESQKINKHGIYLLKINQNSSWKYIIVDDYIPVTIKHDGKAKKYEPAFMDCHKINNKSSEIQIWPFLLQKAYAKYYGTYQSLRNVEEIDFLEELTGCPTEVLDVKIENMGKITEQIKNYDTIMLCQSKDGTFMPVIPRKMQVTLEKIQENGYSTKTYEQDYLIRHFEKIYCIFLHKYFYAGHCTIKQYNKSDKAEPMSIRYFKLEQQSQCVLSIIQKDMKHYQSGYQYCWVRMIVAQKESQKNYRWVDGTYKKNKSTHLKLDLEPGEYYVLVYPEWKSQPFDLNLVFHANSICQLERKSYLGNEHILIEAAMDLAQRNGRMKQLNSNICTYSYIQRNLGLIIENINNERPNGHIRILRSIEGLQKNNKYKIKAFNKEFKLEHTIQVKIESLQHYTVVLGLLGGRNDVFLNQFDFGS